MNAQELLKTIGEISDKKNAATLTFIDRVVTLSSSMLVLSIAFRTSMIGPAATNLWLLKVAWVALAVSSVCGAFIHLSTASAGRRLLIRMQANHNEGSASAHPIYTLLYVFLVISFPVGIAALMAFGIVNTN